MRRSKFSYFMAVLSLFLCINSVSMSSKNAEELDDNVLKAILYITGSPDVENLSNEVVDKFYYLFKHPLKINLVSISRLISSNLFSNYQAASLYDYKTTNGDILSFTELSYLDGFTHEYVEALKPFISLESYNPILKSYSKNSVNQEVLLRFTDRLNVFQTSTKTKEEIATKTKVKDHVARKIQDQSSKIFNNTMKYGFKYALNINEKYELKFTGTTNYNSNIVLPEIYNFALIKYGRKHLGKFIIGDFNMKLGQGMALWSGFSMSGFYSADACDKRGTGLSSPWSFTGSGSLRGVAADYSFGRFTLTSGLALPGLRNFMQNDVKYLNKRVENGYSLPFDFMPITNLTYYGHNGQLGLSFYNLSAFRKNSSFETQKCNLSLDGRYNFRGVKMFSEIALDVYSKFPAALVGTVFPIVDNMKLGLVCNYCLKENATKNNKLKHYYRCAGVLDFYFGKRVPIKGKTGFGATEFRHYGTFSVDYNIKSCKKSNKSNENSGNSGNSESNKSNKGNFSSKTRFSLNYNYRLNPSISSSARLIQTFNFSEYLYKNKYFLQKRISRTDFRCDLKYISLPWQATLRNNIVLTNIKSLKKELNVGFLTYLESGYNKKPLIAWIRFGYFNIPTWNERIYAYSREAPGNFYVPAYYGKGFWLSTLLGWNTKFRLDDKMEDNRFKSLKVYLKLDTLLKEKIKVTASLQCYYAF